jgi:hypothetical protein
MLHKKKEKDTNSLTCPRYPGEHTYMVLEQLKDTPSPALRTQSLLTALFCSHACDLYHTKMQTMLLKDWLVILISERFARHFYKN